MYPVVPLILIYTLAFVPAPLLFPVLTTTWYHLRYSAKVKKNVELRRVVGQCIPLTNRVRGPYRKLRTEFFPPRFMAQARSARAINRRGKNEDP